MKNLHEDGYQTMIKIVAAIFQFCEFQSLKICEHRQAEGAKEFSKLRN